VKTDRICKGYLQMPQSEMLCFQSVVLSQIIPLLDVNFRNSRLYK
jgi:hypothetical protein